MNSANINNISNSIVNTIGIFNDNVDMNFVFSEQYQDE